MRRQEQGNRDGENVLCPLFIEFRENELRCESHVPEAAAVIIRYSDREACRTQRKLFCEGCWKKCEHFLAWKHFREWEE